MAVQFTFYTAIYLLGVVLSIAAAVYAFPARSNPGGRWLLWMCIAIAAWCVAEAFDFSSTVIGLHVLAAQLSYLGATTGPVFFFLFALEYSGRAGRLPAWARWALFVIPAFTIVAGFTNGLHHLVWTGFYPEPGQATIIIYGHGPIYWLVTLYSLLLGVVATMALIVSAARSRGLYRTRTVVVIVAALLPWVAELGYSLAPHLLLGLDPSLTLSITCALIVMAISRYQLLDLVPVSREVLIEEMGDGVVVLDAAGRVLEMNPAAVSLLDLPWPPRPGTQGRDVFSDWSQDGQEAVRAVYEDRSATLESPAGLFIGVERTRIGGPEGAGDRDLFILRDITGQVRAERALQDAYGALQARMVDIERLQAELLEQATRDPLTGLHNRRYLDEELAGELARAERAAFPVSVLMFDVDHFKDVNDTYGHAVGDDVLRTIARLLAGVTRAGDTTCRFGGDEFVVVLPHASTDDAVGRAQQLRRVLRDSMCAECDDRARPTVSIGVATFPTHASDLDRLMAAADRAVYVAKAAGRDCVRVAEAPDRAADGSLLER